jgi:proteasome lid subunit RPN8/RPN11
VVVPDAVRRAVVEHARAEAPNESCGLLVLKDGVAERYERGRNAAASPYRFELEVDPELWFLEDDGYELAVLHSHVSSRAYPSRTDIENIGLWTGKPYVIYCLREDELAAFEISENGEITERELRIDRDT